MRTLLGLALLALLVLGPGSAAANTAIRVDAPEGAPATAFLTVNASGPRELVVTLPPGARIDGLALDSAPAPWRWVRADALRVDLDAGSHVLVLHAELPGRGPWRIGAVAPLTVEAPGLDVALDGDAATVARPAPSGPSPWLAVAGAAAVALLAAAFVARRDRARGPAAEEAGLLDHLRELQSRLRVSIFVVALLLVFFAAFGLAEIGILGRAIAVPVPGQPTVAVQVYHAMVEQFLPPGVTVVVLRPMDAVVAELWVAALLAVVASLPVLAYEASAFLGPALLPDEQRVVRRVLPLVAGLFLLGAAFAWFLLVPILLGTLYAFAPGIGAVAFLSAPELVTFAALLSLVLGFVFEIPIVMAAVARAGLVKPRTFASKWRHAIVVVFVVAAIVTPDPTVVSQLFVAVPMVGLYGVGVLAAYAVSTKE